MSLLFCYDMEHGSTLHNNQNNLLSTLVSNFGTQGDFSHSIKFDSVAPSANILVTANTNENPIEVQDILQTGTQSILHSTEARDIDLNRSESVNESSVTDSIPLVQPIRKSVSHTNIRKTIDEIANTQRSIVPTSTMPQNTLLESALSISNIATSVSSGNEYIPGRNNMELMASGHNAYQAQNWNTGIISSGNNVTELCETPGYVDSRQLCAPANDSSTTMAYPNTNITGCFPSNQLQRNDYQAQQQFAQATTCSTDANQLDQFLQSSQIPMQGYQQHLPQDNYAVPTTQGLASISSYDKVNSYNTAPMFINNNLPVPVTTPYSTNLHQSLPMSYNNGSCAVTDEAFFPKPTHIQMPHDMYADMTSEDGAIENHNNEKKLTTTPIPSDAEKMSSSSSMSSCSPEESPSSQETDSDPNLMSSRLPGSKTTFPITASESYAPFSNKNHVNQDHALLNQTSITTGVKPVEVYMNENLQNQIPVPENVVEIDESAIDFNMVEVASNKDAIPVSPTNPSDPNQSYPSTNQINTHVDSVTATSKKEGSRSEYASTFAADSNSSWSVLKEERRKQKLEKKMQQAKQLELSAPSSNDKLDKSDSQSRKHHRHKHKHRSKHYHIPPNVISTPVLNNTSTNSYSGLIPKVNADPTSNMKLNYKPPGPPRSITEKVKQQMMKEKLKAAGLASKHAARTKPTPPPPHSKTTPPASLPTTPPNSCKSNSYSHIAPAKFGSLSSENSSDKNTCRWQTVTAIEGPKLPPVLSEIDRIPKRGRPSKKMTQMNLKSKGDSAAQKNKVEPAKNVPDATNIVSMYTINESGAIEKLENKPKQNQRSKERAEAFRNELLEISKKTIIQKKTAGAKDAVGAFKAVGVRTRKQASSNNVNGERDETKKKTKVKNKVFGGDASNSGKQSGTVIDEDCAYTFSELAKQFKISHSILHRAIEQSHRSSTSKKSLKSSLKQKHHEYSSSKPPTSIEKTKESKPQVITTENEKEPDMSTEKPSSSSPIKPTSLSSEKSADLTFDVVKRKKKKKKHKKEKNEFGKKKKNKDKKKKSKRKEAKDPSDLFFTSDPNNEVFSVSTSAAESSMETVSAKPGKKISEKKTKDLKEVEKTRRTNERTPIESTLKKVDSVSSLSTVEDDCDGGVSSSDVETNSLPQPTAEISVSAASSSSVATVASPTTSSTSGVFGSGMSSIMPTFQGIKEHGGLQQFSDHTKNLTEGNVFRAKKHKHKKKKPVSRAKNVADPEFLSKIEKLGESWRKMKLSSNGFQASPFGSKPSNVFAITHQVKSISDGSNSNDDFLYRDPTASRNKQKQQPSTADASSAGRGHTSSKASDTTDMSVFCRSAFFKTHGYIKPYTISSGVDLLKTPISQNSLPLARNKFEFTSTPSLKLPVFSKSPSTSVVSETKNASSCKIQTSVNNSTPQSETTDASVNSSQGKGIKRKRGWPRGKPRGSRTKQLPSSNEELSSPVSDIGPSEDLKESEIVQKSTFGSSTTTSKQFSATESTASKPAEVAISKLTDLTSSAAGTLTSATASTPINQDLVNHIKAAITASLSSAVVCSDTVAKTVDSAVASYIQNYDPSVDPAQSGQPSKSTAKKLTTEKTRPRGRPPKYAKLSEQLLDNNDSSKTSDKHPKKLWASKHQGVSELDKIPNKPEKRRPGRPRKYPSVNVEPPAKLQKKSAGTKTPKNSQISKPSESSISCRASAAFTPPLRTTLKSGTTEQKQPKSTTKGKRPSLVAESYGATSLSKKQKEHYKSSKSRKVNMQLTTDSDLLPLTPQSSAKNNDLWNETGKNQKENLLADAEEHNKSLTDSSLKGTVKKSLESVVAKLKSKQTPVSLLPSFADEEGSDTESRTSSTKDSMASNATTKERVMSDSSDSLDNSESRKRANTNVHLSKPKKRKRDSDDSEQKKRKKFSNGQRKNEPIKKKWLNAGLFSPSYKQNNVDFPSDADEKADDYVLFPPPVHAGLFLRQQPNNFQIPFDIWSLFKQNKISATQSVSENYFKIDKNIYYDVTPTNDRDIPVCDCSPKTSDHGNCESNCRNRQMRIECSEETCPCGTSCCNNAIQKKNHWSDFEKFQTPDKGWGLRTTVDIPQGQFLTQYIGEVVSEAEFNCRWIENYSVQPHHYSVQLETGQIIDAYRCSNEARYINHSCQPNCEIQKWYSGNEYHLCLFSNQPIKSGQELTYDYATYAYNMLDQPQACRCRASNCRGKIVGNSSQAIETTTSRLTSKPLSNKEKASQDEDQTHQLLYTTVYENHMQPTSAEEKKFIKTYRPFMLRNLTKIKRQHELLNKQILNRGTHETDTPRGVNEAERRKLLYDVIKDIFDRIMACKDENGVSVALPFINLRLKQSGPDHKKDPFDLSFVEDKIVAKQYEKFEEFSADLLHAFRNAEKQFGRKSSLGKDVARLRRVYASSRNAALTVLGETREKGKSKDTKKSNMDVEDRRRSGDFIRCICGIYKDEGVMIQCEKCYVWQHCDCMQVKPGDYNDDVVYLCEECDDREVPQEVEVVPQPPSAPPGHTYYLTLLKDNLLIRQGDCVRLIHDHCLRQRPSNYPPIRSSYRLQSHSAPERMNFFRIVKLWTDDNGDKFAYGYHFVRPNDTKHAEARAFFTNELLATPYHEIVPLDAVVNQCCVMDLETYRRGKPKEFKECDIFICQHRTDLSLRIVNTVIKNLYPICTKPHVFDTYPVRLVTVRNYQVPEQCRKSQSRRMQWLKSMDSVAKSDDEDSSDDDDELASEQSSFAAVTMDTSSVESDDERVPSNERNFKERRLNGILKKLIKDANSRKPSKCLDTM